MLTPYLVILVKSKYSHFRHREVIRNTWGQSDPTKQIRTVFLVGFPPDLVEKQKTLDKITDESSQHGDIIQQDFNDVYYNNTLKTLMAIKWINKYCSNSKYYLLIDDDFFLSNSQIISLIYIFTL